MSLGEAPVEGDIFDPTIEFCDSRVAPASIYSLLHREAHRLFANELFADLFSEIGRRSVPPTIVAVVMVLQRFEGLSDREAVERVTFDLRWKYACGVDVSYPGFVHTVLVDMRARLRRSERPNRIFEMALEVAKQAGLVGRRRVLDSTALYDAVATQDTVTMLRAAIRNLLRVCDEATAAAIRGALQRNDDYKRAGKPECDWDDAKARDALVDELVRDANAALACLEKRKLDDVIEEAATLLATVVGQDVEALEDGTFRIARRVAPDRIISVVDPEARHGHKTAARGFDGYKGHIAIDPDSEIVTATVVTPGNVGDGSVATKLLEDVLPAVDPNEVTSDDAAVEVAGPESANSATNDSPIEVYGDASYGTGEILEHLVNANAEAMVKVQPAVAPDGLYTKEQFAIDLNARTVTCPNAVVVPIRLRKDGTGIALFGASCTHCPRARDCTKSDTGRTLRVHKNEALLSAERERQKSPNWKIAYRATRPKVERKLAHMMRRCHGGRRARMRGTTRIGHDFALLGAATNLARLAALGLQRCEGIWTR